MRNFDSTRRRFLGQLGLSVAATSLSGRLPGGELPPVTRPRATDGDERFEPDWAERLTVTVGRKDADLIGRDDRVLQAAVDYVARLGGGTVHVLPGTYTLRNAVSLPSRIRLLGSGAESVITKIASESATASSCDRRIHTPAARR